MNLANRRASRSLLVAAGSLQARSVELQNLLSLHRDDIRFRTVPGCPTLQSM
jgi:hypothetical protein